MTFNELSILFLEDYKNLVKPSSYLKTSGQFKNHFNPEFGNYELSDITPFAIQRYVYDLNIKFVNYKKVYFILRLAFKFAERNEYISVNPCDNIILPKSLKLAPKRKMFLDKIEIKKLLEAASLDERPYIYPFIRLLLVTGLRRQEIISLTWADIQLNEQFIDINKAVSINYDYSEFIGQCKNNASNRIISIDIKTRETLFEWKKKQASYYKTFGISLHKSSHKQFVFPNQKNEQLSLSMPNKWIKELCRKGGIEDVSPHIFRHTHCSKLMEQSKGNFEAIRLRLGHADMGTMLRYYTHAITTDTTLANTFASIIDEKN